MPTYCFRNKTTHECFDIVLRMSELDAYKAENPHLEQVIGVSKMISGHNLKPPVEFREVLQKIKKANRGSNIETY